MGSCWCMAWISTSTLTVWVCCQAHSTLWVWHGFVVTCRCFTCCDMDSLSTTSPRDSRCTQQTCVLNDIVAGVQLMHGELHSDTGCARQDLLNGSLTFWFKNKMLLALHALCSWQFAYDTANTAQLKRDDVSFDIWFERATVIGKSLFL